MNEGVENPTKENRVGARYPCRGSTALSRPDDIRSKIGLAQNRAEQGQKHAIGEEAPRDPRGDPESEILYAAAQHECAKRHAMDPLASKEQAVAVM